MKTGTINFNGHASNEFGVYVSGTNAHNAAEADMITYSIAGRNGDFVVSNGRYKNIKVSYPAFVARGFGTNEQAIRNWMRKTNFYAELSDSYDTSHFRLGRAIGELVFEPVRPDAAQFEMEFDCYPQRFLTAGTSPLTISGTTVVTNPTDYDAKPLITVSSIAASTEIEFAGDKTITITATTSYAAEVIIDCETQNVYDASTFENKNDLFDLPDGFPVLNSGTNTITVTGTANCSMKPRWWEL